MIGKQKFMNVRHQFHEEKLVVLQGRILQIAVLHVGVNILTEFLFRRHPNASVYIQKPFLIQDLPIQRRILPFLRVDIRYRNCLSSSVQHAVRDRIPRSHIGNRQIHKRRDRLPDSRRNRRLADVLCQTAERLQLIRQTIALLLTL